MKNKKVSLAISLLLAGFLFALKYIGYPSVLPSQQVSNVVQVEPEIQKVATTTASISTTTKSFFVVSRVVDGDTIEVVRDGVPARPPESGAGGPARPPESTQLGAGGKEKVRLIGINTPETVDPRKKVECFGKEASAHAKEILLGQKVKLVSDDTQTKYDKYGRLLAYVYREDGLFVNKYMIEEGYAYEYTYRVPYKFQKEFKEAQLKAQTEGRGLWKVGVCE